MLGVVIGRFQTPYLHEGYQDLINYARNKSDKLLILIGVSDAVGTDREPMDFETRKGLFLNNDIVMPLKDIPCDIDWSNQVDNIIKSLGFEKAIIFGGKDNFICGYYKGEHEINIMIAKSDKNATDLRKSVKVKSSQDFREGIIYHTQKRHPIVYSTVNIIIRKDEKFLVEKKGDKYCFVGGFVDAGDETLEDAALREFKEKTGITQFCGFSYLSSMKINDYRYAKTKDSIMTNCFFISAEDTGNEIEDKDFIWCRREELNDLLHDSHKSLYTAMRDSWCV
jgi:bifunctional NMN adenylyltransferase/nudix hydrolase